MFPNQKKWFIIQAIKKRKQQAQQLRDEQEQKQDEEEDNMDIFETARRVFKRHNKQQQAETQAMKNAKETESGVSTDNRSNHTAWLNDNKTRDTERNESQQKTTPVFTPSEEHNKVIDLVSRGKSVVMTGEGGTGKSALIQHLRLLISYSVYVTAMTGIAAQPLRGTTLHSFFGVEPHQKDANVIIANLRQKKTLVIRRIKKCKMLIIDEASMLDGNFFDTLDEVCRVIRENDKPMGGIQVILSFDAYQLGPFVQGGGPVVNVFDAKVFKSLFGDNIVEFSVNYRQTNDPDYRGICSRIRQGLHTEYDCKYIKSLENNDVKEVNGVKPIQLYTHNADVDEYNAKELAKLDGTPHYFRSNDSGPEWALKPAYNGKKDSFELKGVLAKKDLFLKIGAQVILLKNLKDDHNLVNGLQGVVTDMVKRKHGQQPVPKVRFINGIERVTTPEDFDVMNGDEVLMKRTQIPLNLAYAITIHKSQGMTLHSGVLHVGGAFATGQVYVGLSRFVSSKDLKVIGFDKTKVKVDAAVHKFYDYVASLPINKTQLK